MSVHWIQKQNLHITLMPPWDEENIDLAREKLKQVEKVGEFEIIFDNISFGPNPKCLRLIWASGRVLDKFVILKKNLENIFGQYDEHDLFPHLTLARFNPNDFRKFKTRELNEKVDWKEKVKSIVLFQSETPPEGARYITLEEIKI